MDDRKILAFRKVPKSNTSIYTEKIMRSGPSSTHEDFIVEEVEDEDYDDEDEKSEESVEIEESKEELKVESDSRDIML